MPNLLTSFLLGPNLHFKTTKYLGDVYVLVIKDQIFSKSSGSRSGFLIRPLPIMNPPAGFINPTEN